MQVHIQLYPVHEQILAAGYALVINTGSAFAESTVTSWFQAFVLALPPVCGWDSLGAFKVAATCSALTYSVAECMATPTPSPESTPFISHAILPLGDVRAEVVSRSRVRGRDVARVWVGPGD